MVGIDAMILQQYLPSVYIRSKFVRPNISQKKMTFSNFPPNSGRGREGGDRRGLPVLPREAPLRRPIGGGEAGHHLRRRLRSEGE